jgi:hypothetical protein
MKTVEIDQKKVGNLRKWNIGMGFLHLAQGIAMLLLSSSFAIPVIGNFLNFDLESQSLKPVAETIFNLRIGPAVAAFLIMSALAHFLVSTILYKWYLKNLSQHINIARWVEYAFSSTLMLVIIAMLVGIYDVAALIALAGLNASMILFGWMMELHNQSTNKTDWTSFIFGCIAGIIPWIAVAIYLFAAGEGEYRAPDFVYWIYFSIFVFFNTFAINQVLQYKKVGKWADYLYGEKAYIILSLVAKTLLAWQVFAGTLRPM